MRIRVTGAVPALLFAIGLSACGNPASQNKPATTEAAPPNSGFNVPAGGCYLGGETSRGDSTIIRIADYTDGAVVAGEMTVALHEKDRRSGTFQGQAGADGIVRATYTFMQEGVAQAVKIQFIQQPGDDKTLLLRPAAYDSSSGAEYPDSNQAFSIRLTRMPCGNMGDSKFDRVPPAVSSGR